MDEFMTCDQCGEDNWEYVGEAYDDGEHMGSLWECLVCHHHQCDDDPQQDFEFYDEIG